VINPTTAGGAAGGTVTFSLYGPFAAGVTPVCTGTPIFTSTVALVGGSTAASANFQPTAAGTYVWVGSYSGDSPNTTGPVANGCNDTNESVVVSPNQPGITTNATAEGINGDPSVPVGTAISDSATMTGLASPSNGTQGTITFRAYGPFADKTTCTAPAIYTSVVTITGNGTFVASSGTGGTFTPTAAGNYNWIASYTPATGDVNNLSVAGQCGDANEGSVVIQLQPTIGTVQTYTLQDAATVTIADGGSGKLAGTIRFRLYRNTTCDGTPQNALVYDSRVNNQDIPVRVPERSRNK